MRVHWRVAVQGILYDARRLVALQRIQSPSWSGLTRPSAHHRLGVDGRVRPDHDGYAVPCDRGESRNLRLLVLLAVISIVCAIAGPSSAQSASSYQMSCGHIGVAGSTLFAECRRIDGSFSRTSIAIPGVENINGRLQFNGMGYVSTFQNSCTNIGVAGSTLFANCRRMDGGFNRTSIPIFGIANIDGVLRYQ